MELTEENYCDQQPVAIEFTFEEHDLLNSILCHAADVISLAIPCIYDIPKDSEIRQRYEMIEEMRNRSYDFWQQRYRK